MKVYLTRRAAKSYRSIQVYIATKWGEKVALAFEQKAVDFLELLIEFPEMGAIEVPDKLIRGFQLTRNTRIFYRIKGEQIIILAFFDVRQDPTKKPK